MSFIALLCILAALALLVALAAIDLRTYLLPDRLNLPLFITGVTFHIATAFQYESLAGMVLGVLIGGGLLYGVRFFANKYYKQDSLGLGDVKLLMAAGVWLGPHDVLLAIIIGAFAGIVHGLGLAVKRKTKNLGTLNLPAGPGFIIGILVAGILKFRTFFDLFF